MSDLVAGPVGTPFGRALPGRLARAAARPATAAGLVVVALHLLLALAAPFVVPYETSAMLAAPLSPPDAMHWFGTDLLGRGMVRH